MTDSKFPGTVLIYTIHNSEAWWRVVGENLGFEHFATVSDMRGEGDYNVVRDFYRHYRRYRAANSTASNLLSAEDLDNVIARCRVLRWLPRRKAVAMALAMADAMDAVLEQVSPVAIVSWPMDRYIMDVLERNASARGIPYFELTVSPIDRMSMLLYRGVMVERQAPPDADMIDSAVATMANPAFTPSYVRGVDKFTARRWWKTFLKFRLRGYVFRAISHFQRDPLNLHYVDAQAYLGHKPRAGDVAMLGLQDEDWRSKLASVPVEKRLFLALQLFPEASIDYWIEDLGLVDHEAMLVEAATAFSNAGFVVAVKDHPLQFGFRRIDLIKQLKALPNVSIVPYRVSGNEVLDNVGVTLTCTGTLGMQSAMLGLKAVTSDTYFTTPGDFVFLRSRSDVAGLPAAVEAFPLVGDLPARQRRIVEKLLRGSFPGDMLSFKGFRGNSDPEPVVALAQRLGEQIYRLGNGGEQWHARHLGARWRTIAPPEPVN